MKYHYRPCTNGVIAMPVCGAPGWIDRGTTNALNVTCSACRALIPKTTPDDVLVVKTFKKTRWSTLKRRAKKALAEAEKCQ